MINLQKLSNKFEVHTKFSNKTSTSRNMIGNQSVEEFNNEIDELVIPVTNSIQRGILVGRYQYGLTDIYELAVYALKYEVGIFFQCARLRISCLLNGVIQEITYKLLAMVIRISF